MRLSLSVQMMGMGFVYQSATCVTSMMIVLMELMSRTAVQVSSFIGHLLQALFSLCI